MRWECEERKRRHGNIGSYEDVLRQQIKCQAILSKSDKDRNVGAQGRTHR